MFKLWSQTSSTILIKLKPNLGMRSFTDLSLDEKELLWQYLHYYFFDRFETEIDKKFLGEYSERQKKETRIFHTIGALNEKYKSKTYAKNFIKDFEFNSALEDFLHIFLFEEEEVVFELITLYCKLILKEREDEKPYREDSMSDEEFDKFTIEWKHEDLDNFAERLNVVFGDFGIKVYLTRDGFIPRQDEKIIKEIYEPVLKYLSDKKWSKVNDHLSKSFKDYQEKKYSTSITNCISAIQAFLQILIRNSIGTGNITELIKEAIKRNKIPNDSFSTQIFRNIDSIFAKDRHLKSDAHPTLVKADEKSARLVLNLAMIFIQHCIQR